MAQSQPIRVLYVSHVGAACGANRSLRFLISHLPTGSVEPIVVSPPGSAAEGFRFAGARVIEVPAVSTIVSLRGAPLRGMRLLTLLREAWRLRHGRRLRQVIEETKPHLVHLNERGMYQAARISGRLGLPVVVHARSVADDWSRWLGFVDDRCAKYVSMTVAIDDSVRRGLRGGACRVIYNPLPVPASKAVPPAKPNPRLVVAFLAGLLPCKGIWDLLEAAKLLKSNREIAFHVYGGNSYPDEFFRSISGRVSSWLGLASDVEGAARRWLEREGLNSSVRLFGKRSPDAALFQQMDILVFPSHLNGVGRSIFEAGVHGVPSVVTLEDKVNDVVEDQVTGLITSPHDPRALAAAILRLAEDRELRVRLGESARLKYSAQFDPQKAAFEMVDLYRDVLTAQSSFGPTRARTSRSRSVASSLNAP